MDKVTGVGVGIEDTEVILAVSLGTDFGLETKNIIMLPIGIIIAKIIHIFLYDIINVIIFLMKGKVLVLIFGLIFLFSATSPVLAAKKRVWGATTTKVSSGGGSFSISAKLTGWKQYLNLSFRGVTSTSGVTYELIYNGNNTEQGIYGNIKTEEGNTSRSLFLGTCSSNGVCTSHKNINNMRLTVSYKTTSGQSVTKRYKVKY